MKLLNLGIVLGSALLLASCSSADPEQDPVPDAGLSQGEPSAESPEADANDEPSSDTPAVEAVERTEGERVAIGNQAPAFQLKDQNGEEHSLEDLLKDGKLAVVFYRSADW